MKNKSKLALLVTSSALLLASCGGGEASSISPSNSSSISEPISSSSVPSVSSSSKESPISSSSSSISESSSSSSSNETSNSSSTVSSSSELSSNEETASSSSSSASEPVSSSSQSSESSSETSSSSSSESQSISSSTSDSSSSIEQSSSEISSSQESSSSSSESSASSSSSTTSSESSSSSSSSDSSSSSSDPIKTYYTVTFDTMGGSEVTSQSIEEGDKASKPDDPTKDDCIFGGWYLSSKFTKQFDFETPITTDYTLFAKWISNSSSSDSSGDSSSSSPIVTTVEYWIAGDFSGTSWSKDGAIQMEQNQNGDDLGVKYNVSIEAGGSFKVTNFTDWYGYNDLLSEVASNGDGGNIVIKQTGIYNIYLNRYASIWIEKVSSGSQDSSDSISTSEPTSSSSSSDSSIDSSSSGSSSSSEESKTNHAPDGAATNNWFIIGEGSLWKDSSWSKESGIQMFDNPGSTDIACYLNITFTDGDYFKFYNGTNYIGYSNVNQWSDDSNLGKSNFVADNMDNFKCNVTGTYSIYINNSKQIWICAGAK